jgi:hypothetical protein
VTDELFNNLVINPSIESIQEFKIQKSQYPAEFGGKASALINVATRSGANEWQGNAFGFFRNDALDAHNYFDRRDEPVPPLSQQQFGGTLGGPIVRRRSFLFASVELQRMNRSLTRTFTVPDSAVRMGDFSGVAAICDPATITSTDAGLRAVRRQTDSGESARSTGAGVPAESAAANEPGSVPEPDIG